MNYFSFILVKTKIYMLYYCFTYINTHQKSFMIKRGAQIQLRQVTARSAASSRGFSETSYLDF
jgi:hypothetical protein